MIDKINKCKQINDCLNCSYAYLCHQFYKAQKSLSEIKQAIDLGKGFCTPETQIKQFLMFLNKIQENNYQK